MAEVAEKGAEQIEVTDELQPLRILGMPADAHIAVTIITTVVSFFVFVWTTAFLE